MQETLTAILTLLFAVAHTCCFIGGFKSGINAS